MSKCAVCETECYGERCRVHENEKKQVDAAREAEARDVETLTMLAEPGMNANRLGKRVGITRAAARQRILNARRRQAMLGHDRDWDTRLSDRVRGQSGAAEAGT